MIAYDDFKKTELVAATIVAAERVQGSEKLIKLQLDVGGKNTPDLPAGRQVIAGIGKQYEPERLVGTQVIIVANLEPRSLMGLQSQGMLLAAHDADGGAVLLRPDRQVPPGSSIS